MTAAHQHPEYRRNRATLRRWATITQAPCARCGRPILYTAPPTHPLAFTAGHITAVLHGGTHHPDNLRPEHRRCNTSHGATIGNQARAQARTTTTLDNEW